MEWKPELCRGSQVTRASSTPVANASQVPGVAGAPSPPLVTSSPQNERRVPVGSARNGLTTHHQVPLPHVSRSPPHVPPTVRLRQSPSPVHTVLCRTDDMSFRRETQCNG